MRRKYPEPWKRSGSPFYQWWYTNDAGKRQRVSTGEALKERAREQIRKYVDSRDAETGRVPSLFEPMQNPFFPGIPARGLHVFLMKVRALAKLT